MKTFIGIDPGKSGAIVAINKNGRELFKSVTPTIGKEYNESHMRSMLDSFDEPHVVLENINGHVAKGRTTAFVMGEGKGIWRGLLSGCQLPYTMVTPQTWQKEMWQGVPVQKKSNGRKDTKAMSEVAVNRLFPHIDLYVTAQGNKSKNIHDGLADALLMAEYCRRMYHE